MTLCLLCEQWPARPGRSLCVWCIAPQDRQPARVWPQLALDHEPEDGIRRLDDPMTEKT